MPSYHPKVIEPRWQKVWDDAKTFRIGFQKGGVLALAKAAGAVETRLAGRGIAVQWNEFTSGPPLLDDEVSAVLRAAERAATAFALVAAGPRVTPSKGTS